MRIFHHSEHPGIRHTSGRQGRRALPQPEKVKVKILKSLQVIVESHEIRIEINLFLELFTTQQ